MPTEIIFFDSEIELLISAMAVNKVPQNQINDERVFLDKRRILDLSEGKVDCKKYSIENAVLVRYQNELLKARHFLNSIGEQAYAREVNGHFRQVSRLYLQLSNYITEAMNDEL